MKPTVYSTDGCALYLGDATELLPTLPPIQPALILTDPVYQHYHYYAWLSKLDARNTLAFTNTKHLTKTLLAVGRHDTEVLTVIQQNGGALSGSRIAKSYHLLWWSRCNHNLGNQNRMPDGWISNTWAKDGLIQHKWTKNPNYLKLVIERFTKEQELIIDPFAGFGIIGHVAKTLNRRYIGFELDEDSFEVACTNLGKRAEGG